MEVMAVMMNLVGHGLRRIWRWPYSITWPFAHRGVRLGMLFLSLWTACRAAGSSAAPEPDPGLVAYFPFDGDLLDASGFQRHAVSDPAGPTPMFSLARKAAPNHVVGLVGGNQAVPLPSPAGFGPKGQRCPTVSVRLHSTIERYLVVCDRESCHLTNTDEARDYS